MKKLINYYIPKLKLLLANNRKFVSILLLGILLRIIIMPYFAHADFFSMWRRVFKMIEVGNYYPQDGLWTQYSVHVIFAFVLKPFIPEVNSIMFFNNLARSTVNFQDYLLISGHDTIFRTIFLLKIPFLVFDIGVAILLYKFFKDRSKDLLAVKLWLFNPITFYTSYIYGRHEVITVFFILLSIYFLKKDRLYFSATVFALALNSREIVFILLPVYILSIYDYKINLKSITSLVLAILLILTIKFSPSIFVNKILDAKPLFYSNSALGGVSQGRRYVFTGTNINWFYPFFAIYTIVSIWLIGNKNSKIKKVIVSFSAVLFGYFAFCHHSPHYTAWLVVFPVLLAGYDNKYIKPFIFFNIFWIFYWIFASDIGMFTFFLAAPFSTLVRYIPNGYNYYQTHFNNILDVNVVLSILHTCYSSCILVMMYHLYKGKGVKDNE